MANTTDKELENAYLAAEQLYNNLSNQVRSLENQVLAHQQDEQRATIIYNQDPSNIDKANTVVAIRVAIQQTQQQLNNAKAQLAIAANEKEIKYNAWLNWKKDNLKPDELQEFLLIQETIQAEKAANEQKLNSSSFYQKYRQAIFVSLGVVGLIVLLFFIYKYLKNKK